MTDKDLMQQALEALKSDIDAMWQVRREEAIAALRERLAQPEQSRAEKMRDAGYTRRPTLREIASAGEQPEQEPVCAHGVGKTKCDFCKQPEQEAVCDKDPRGCWNVRCQLGNVCKHTPPRRGWQGLTDVERIDLGVISEAVSAHSLIHMVEAKLKEKNA